MLNIKFKTKCGSSIYLFKLHYSSSQYTK